MDRPPDRLAECVCDDEASHVMGLCPVHPPERATDTRADELARVMGYAMATNRFVPGPNQRADDPAWKAVLALADEDAVVALRALKKAGYAPWSRCSMSDDHRATGSRADKFPSGPGDGGNSAPGWMPTPHATPDRAARDRELRIACPACGALVTDQGAYYVEYGCGSLKTFQGWYGPCGREPRPSQYGSPQHPPAMWQCPTCGGPLTADGRYPDPYCRACEAVGL